MAPSTRHMMMDAMHTSTMVQHMMPKQARLRMPERHKKARKKKGKDDGRA